MRKILDRLYACLWQMLTEIENRYLKYMVMKRIDHILKSKYKRLLKKLFQSSNTIKRVCTETKPLTKLTKLEPVILYN